MNWQNCTIATSITSLNIRVTSAQSGVVLTYLGGTYTTSNSRFSILGGLSTWKGFKVISPLASSTFALAGIQKFEGLYVT